MTRRAGSCSASSASPSRKATDGEDWTEGQGRSQAEVQGARLHPLPALRPPEGRLPQVRPVPDLPAGDGPPRRAARRHQVELVTSRLASSHLNHRTNQYVAGRASTTETA